ncbi:MAG TPA: cation-transporting P-type ATPase, partial [Tenuifilaceae bacterium]|nr:cation-transporting P-type ATPase [Tenuifilaceae bacterium]
MSEDKIFHSGLTTSQVDESRRKFGNNILTPPARDPWWKLLLEKFDDPIIRILIIAAGIAVIVGFFHGNFIEGIGIIIAILLATLMAFFNEFRAGLEFDILNKVSDKQPVKVMRNGGVTAVPISDIVVGDVVIVDTGEEVPADGRILSSISLGVNESTLTGELLVYKHANADSISEEHTYPSNMLYRGTTIMEGNATFEVTAVGNSTEIGKTAREASIQINDPIPLSLQLERLSKLIGVVGFSVAFIAFWGFMLFDYFSGKLVLTPQNWFSLFAILIPLGVILVRVWLPIVLDLLQFLEKPISPPQILSSKLCKAFPKLFIGAVLLFAVFYGVGQLYGINLFSATAWFSIETAEQILLFILVAITLIVVAVPEGLAMSVTLSLAYSMRKMTATNNLVRRMQATETMGATTVIC